MKRVLMLVIVLLAISVITPMIAYAPATRTEIVGTYTMSVTSIGAIDITKSNIMHQVGAEASGPISSTALSGNIQIVLNAIVNLNTGEGVAFGAFTVTDVAGAFEGRFTVWDTEYIHYTGKLQGYGRGAYAGMILKLEFEGTDLYRGGYTGPDGLTASFSGYLMSPHDI